jgi:transcriptional regulator with XRE-family HTH domain
MTKLADELREWRRAFGLTQAEAAEHAGYSRSQYGRFERSASTPPRHHWDRLHAVMDAMYAGAWIERDRGANL